MLFQGFQEILSPFLPVSTYSLKYNRLLWSTFGRFPCFEPKLLSSGVSFLTLFNLKEEFTRSSTPSPRLSQSEHTDNVIDNPTT